MDWLTLSRDLRDRGVDAVVGGLLCRQAAQRFRGVAASAIRWQHLELAHDTPAGKVSCGDNRTAKIKAHAAFILKAIEMPCLGADGWSNRTASDDTAHRGPLAPSRFPG